VAPGESAGGAGVGLPPGSNAGAWSSEPSSTSSSTTQVAKGEAANVKDTAVDAGAGVAATAKEQAGNVVSEAASQAKGLLSQVRGEVGDQAGTQLQRIAGSLHSMSKELGSMASSSSESGPIADLAHEAARRGGEIAHWLENRQPSDVLEEVRSFARRRPVAFLGLAFAAGLVAGRVTRGAVAANTSVDSGSSSTATPAITAGDAYDRPDFVATGTTVDPYAQPVVTDPYAPATVAPPTGEVRP